MSEVLRHKYLIIPDLFKLSQLCIDSLNDESLKVSISYHSVDTSGVDHELRILPHSCGKEVQSVNYTNNPHDYLEYTTTSSSYKFSIKCSNDKYEGHLLCILEIAYCNDVEFLMRTLGMECIQELPLDLPYITPSMIDNLNPIITNMRRALRLTSATNDIVAPLISTYLSYANRTPGEVQQDAIRRGLPYLSAHCDKCGTDFKVFNSIQDLNSIKSYVCPECDNIVYNLEVH